jgi:hypothetical protein
MCSENPYTEDHVIISESTSAELLINLSLLG